MERKLVPFSSIPAGPWHPSVDKDARIEQHPPQFGELLPQGGCPNTAVFSRFKGFRKTSPRWHKLFN
jgi:hypothetical protein